MRYEWIVAKATVTGCSPSLLHSSWGDSTNAPRTEYRLTFTYRVNGEQYHGSMRVGSSWKVGRSFEVSYDPRHPKRNTASRSFDPYDWRMYLFYGVVWCIALLVFYFCIRFVPTKAEMLRP